MRVSRAAALTSSAFLAALGAAGLAGCPPSLDDPEAFQTTCPAGFSVDALLLQNCALASCHASGPNPADGLDLGAADAFDRMYGVASVCGPPLISPAGPSQSYLLAKLEGTAACGARMPLGRTPLSASDLLCVEAWITAGIAQAGPPPPPDAGSDAAPLPDSGMDAGDDAGDAGDDAEGGPGDAGDAGDAG